MWDHVRALLITVHLLAVVLSALPAPVGMRAQDLEDPSFRESLAPIHGALQAAGYGGSEDDLARQLFEAGEALLETRRTVLRPFDLYYRHLGTRQSWRMFGTVNDKPARVEVFLDHGDGTWAPLYIAREPEHAWRAHQLDQERFRAFMNDYSWRRDKRSWDHFTAWLARQAARDFPEASRLQALVRYRPIPRPAKLRELGERPSGKAFWTVEHDLEEVRRELGGAGSAAP